ncbi:MAG: Rrf2 family transcriptional regulator [bacterium]
MKLSTRSRYGLRAMIDIAMQYNEPVLLKDIASLEHLSMKYLDHIMGGLKRAGLIRRVNEGYLLSRQPEEITAYDIISVLESSVKSVDCEMNRSDCFKSNACAAMELWQDLNESIEDTLKARTLKELASKQRKKEEIYE